MPNQRIFLSFSKLTLPCCLCRPDPVAMAEWFGPAAKPGSVSDAPLVGRTAQGDAKTQPRDSASGMFAGHTTPDERPTADRPSEGDFITRGDPNYGTCRFTVDV